MSVDSGAVDYMMDDRVFALPRHREGKLRVLAVTSKERMTTAPDIPTIDESGVPGVRKPSSHKRNAGRSALRGR
jgi:tripartite-type tricarboxylate transporter receptor subunit TctC